MSQPANYGQADATYQAVGGENGVRRLVDEFYRIMATNLEYATIYAWHNEEASKVRDKLARFLCGWMGGPRSYTDHYGSINIPGVHAHLAITEVERDQWLGCMQQALAQQDYPADLQRYLIEQLAVPAEMIRRACAH